MLSFAKKGKGKPKTDETGYLQEWTRIWYKGEKIARDLCVCITVLTLESCECFTYLKTKLD